MWFQNLSDNKVKVVKTFCTSLSPLPLEILLMAPKPLVRVCLPGRPHICFWLQQLLHMWQFPFRCQHWARRSLMCIRPWRVRAVWPIHTQVSSKYHSIPADYAIDIYICSLGITSCNILQVRWALQQWIRSNFTITITTTSQAQVFTHCISELLWDIHKSIKKRQTGS